jgi:hypothetical protein
MDYDTFSATISGHGKKKRAMATLQKANGSPQTDLAKHWNMGTTRNCHVI